MLAATTPTNLMIGLLTIDPRNHPLYQQLTCTLNNTTEINIKRDNICYIIAWY